MAGALAQRVFAISTLWRWLVVVLLLSPSASMAAPLDQQTTAGDSPFKRIDDFPPDDFLAALGWAGGGAGNEGTHCSIQLNGDMVPKPCVLGLNDILQPSLDDAFFTQGWSRDDLVTFTVRQPDGSLLAEDQDEFGNDVWSIDLDAPTGIYSVTARQGPRMVSSVFRVVARAGQPVIRVVPRTTWTGDPIGNVAAVAPGTTVDVLMAGFAPNQAIKLLLFDDGESHFYRTTLATIRVDGAGRAIYPVSLSTDDRGAFRFQTSPMAYGVAFPSGFGAGLCITPPPSVEPCLRTPESSTLLFQRLVSQSNQLWAAVAGHSDAPLLALRCVYKGDFLAAIAADLADLRRRGEYVVARETAPPTIVQVMNVAGYGGGDRVALVDVVEHLSVLVYNADGSFLEDLSGDIPHHYTFAQDYEVRFDNTMPPSCRAGWVITQDG